MKLLPSGLQAHLDSGATTLCWCWRLTRHDGVVLGFTDHDRDVAFDGTTFEAEAGMTAGELTSSLDLSVDTVEIDGAITSDRLTEADLSAGLFDNARVEVFRVNWSDVSQRVLMRSGSLGEVRRSDDAFTAEIRGLSHHLQQPRGRLYQYTCDAVLGDAKCGVDLSASAFAADVVVVGAPDTHTVDVSGAVMFADDWFARGLATVVSGANAGRTLEVKAQRANGGATQLTFWDAAPHPFASGDDIALVAGCDKHFATCTEKFANAENFRGFPFIPGTDLLTRTGG
ncbi:MAG: DUF2163 domain-containing protein [Pseudomonadota bacterium]